MARIFACSHARSTDIRFSLDDDVNGTNGLIISSVGEDLAQCVLCDVNDNLFDDDIWNADVYDGRLI